MIDFFLVDPRLLGFGTAVCMETCMIWATACCLGRGTTRPTHHDFIKPFPRVFPRPRLSLSPDPRRSPLLRSVTRRNGLSHISSGEAVLLVTKRSSQRPTADRDKITSSTDRSSGRTATKRAASTNRLRSLRRRAR